MGDIFMTKESNKDVEKSTNRLKEMFVDIVQEKRVSQGQYPVKRPVFLKPHGIAYAEFEVSKNLPSDLKIGIFSQEKKLKACVRFSSDTTPDSLDYKTTCGVAIKLFGVKGEKLIEEGDTHDFILQNHDVFFVDNAKEMTDFTAAGVIDKDYNSYLVKYPKTNVILNEMAKAESSSLLATYWSVLPYAFGKNKNVKYKLVPESTEKSIVFDDADYLAKDLKRRLLNSSYKFKFMVQFSVDDKSMPIDEATVRWDEKLSKPIEVATLIINKQDITTVGQDEFGENLSFNPWHCLEEHKPLGSISEARKVVYKASADNRRIYNGIPINEPTVLPIREDLTLDKQIVSAAIHPSIGVARVGNSENEYFIGPETLDLLPQKTGFYRDSSGAIKRQAARFRIYGLNARGEVVKEITGSNAEIEWNVHLANKKSSWYQFQLALDIPEASKAHPSLLRNSTISERDKLTIDAGSKLISKKTGIQKFIGKFMDNSVYLGEAFADENNRLIVLGGKGKSFSYDGTKAVTFANNEGWCDDISDGSVSAKVKFDGKELKVAPSWIVVAPPNYAPMQKSVRTMWDLLRDIFVKNNMLQKPTIPSFKNDIKPIFDRIIDLQWVNQGFAAAFGWQGTFNFDSDEFILKLTDSSPANLEKRKIIYNLFRNVDRDQMSPIPLPWVYGDSMSIPAISSRQYSTLSDLQMEMLKEWANGNFINDYDPKSTKIDSLEKVDLKNQPYVLDRAALDNCLADAFHPGCEMTWPMRNPTMFMSPFRIKHAAAGWVEPNYGSELNDDVINLPNGPISGGQLPGGITRWMAVPWQTDTASCRSGYDKSYDPYMPTFWPARVPNEVMTVANYEIVLDKSKNLQERLQAFAHRSSWLTPIGLDQSYTDQINNMINHFDSLSIIEERDGISDDKNFPQKIQVADDIQNYKNNGILEQSKSSISLTGFAEKKLKNDLSKIDKVKRFTREKTIK
jgi:hypothetical protein